MIGRALPLGTDLKMVQSLEAHKEALLSEHVTPPDVLLAALKFA